ncbi:tRNA (adenosine(37)-N6)-threonylcarbamoyltransferase complex ATPase subunit type 1 TsaE [Candidatus Curtissbacteria bacterium]|nr:tRNA (adenosine(37)-N6)-threonylcarbamoyltransferase complex ATPase subunit type 1 TsaE [Candidatus Curtissbacteria bacterium]
MEIKSDTIQKTQKIAHDLAKTLKGGDIVALFGDLGVGKTTFVQGLAVGLGIKKRILSPTFVFIRSYPLTINHKPASPAKRGEPLTFYHIDLYRGEGINDFQDLGLDELFGNDAIVVLEWADKIKNKLPKKRIDVTIETVDETTRRIKIQRR